MAEFMKSMEEDESLFSSITSSGFYPQMPRGESKARRTRRKAKDVPNGDADGEGKKRRLSRDQVRFLEMNFDQERKLESCRKVNLATEIGLDPKQVAIWFQNRRARWKSKKLEEDYNHLKSHHTAILAEKRQLEDEVSDLKDKLVQSEQEIRRLTPPSISAGAGGGSPMSSWTMSTQRVMQQTTGLDNYYDMMEMSYFYGF